MKELASAQKLRPPIPWFLHWPGAVLLLCIFLSWRGSQAQLGVFFEKTALDAVSDFAKGFWPPAHSSDFLLSMLKPLGETVAIAVLGVSLALVIALPLAVLATAPEASGSDRAGPVRRALYHLARMTLNVMRSIPELIWALLFVRALGIGPAPGVLAISVGYAGILGKVFAEIFESVPAGPGRALTGAGASPLQAFTFGVLPTAAPMMASYTLYRFDCALRSSAVLGLVGAGGIGEQIELSMKMFSYDEVAALILALFVLVAAVDQASIWIRGRLRTSVVFLPQGRRALVSRLTLGAAWLGTIALSGWFLDLQLGDLFSRESFKSMAEFARSMFPPEHAADFLRECLPLVGETLAVSVLGTVLAVVMGMLLAYPGAAVRLYQPSPDLPRSWSYTALRAAALVARGIMNLWRTLPELLWALLFIFTVGLGPFAGALALAVHTGGVLGRLYMEAMEEVPRGPLVALEQSGSGPLATTLFGVLPQAFPQLVAYTLYRWEVNIRESTVLGVVGAGGIGTALYLSLSLFQNHRTLTLIALILAMVTACDLFSSWLRRKVMNASHARSAALGQPALQARLGGSCDAVVLGLALRRARLFARPGEVRSSAGERLEVELAHPGGVVRCAATVSGREDHVAGSYLELELHLGPWGMWQLYRARTARPRAMADLRTSLEAF